MGAIQYVTETGETGFFHTERQYSSEYSLDCEILAKQYFATNWDVSSFSVCVIDFGNHEHAMFEFELERKLSYTEY
jgi:hypothetical protein